MSRKIDPDLSAKPKLVSIPRFAAVIGVSKPQAYRLMKSDPDFPKAITIGGRSLIVVEEGDQYIAKRIAARDAGRAA
jgi:predicted DNA-binding transcriptional regulator AlpA